MRITQERNPKAGGARMAVDNRKGCATIRAMLGAAERRLLLSSGRLMELERFIHGLPSLPQHLLPNRPKEGSMKKVVSLFSAGVMTAGIRECSLKKAMPHIESNIANDQAQDTTVERARGNV